MRLFIIMLVVGVIGANNLYASKKAPVLFPKDNEGKKWRIAYYEGGPYQNYPTTLLATVQGLIALGWIKPVVVPKPSDRNDAQSIWTFLSQKIQSPYIEFVQNSFWSTNWENSIRLSVKKKLLKRLRQKKDAGSRPIDLIIAMGTWAGIDLAGKEHNTPTLGLSSRDLFYQR